MTSIAYDVIPFIFFDRTTGHFCLSNVFGKINNFFNEDLMFVALKR